MKLENNWHTLNSASPGRSENFGFAADPRNSSGQRGMARDVKLVFLYYQADCDTRKLTAVALSSCLFAL